MPDEPPPADEGHGPVRAPAALSVLAAAAVACALTAALWSAWQQDWTTDEPLHLEWSRRLLDTGASERDSVLHFNSKTPVMLANVVCRRAARHLLGVRDAQALRLAARLPTVLWLAALYGAVFLVARGLAGLPAAWAAVTLTALEPNLIAHGSLATVDVPFALAVLAVLATAAAVLRQATLSRAALLGLALGFAFATKFTAFLLPGLVVLFALARPWRPAARPPLLRLLLAAAAAALVAVAMVTAAYLGRGLGTALGHAQWKTSLAAAVASALPSLALPVPIDFLRGLDVSFHAERTKDWPVAILGEVRRGAVPYYYALLWLVKTPLALLAAQALGLVLALRSARVRARPVAAGLAVAMAALLAYFSFVFRAKIGYRHALAVVPLACILAGAGLATILGRARAHAFAVLVAVAALAEQVPYLGNHLAFSNALVQPKREAYRVLADSNLDWGQNDDRALAWAAQRGLAAAQVLPPHFVEGPNFLSVHALVFGNHRWARRHLRPAAHFRHTYLLYDVSAADFDTLLGQSRRLPLVQDGPCTMPAAPLASSEVRLTAGAALLCLRAEGPADVALVASSGRVMAGPPSGPRREWDHLLPAQAAWYRLDAGMHALGLARGQDLSARLEARGAPVAWWMVSGP